MGPKLRIALVAVLVAILVTALFLVGDPGDTGAVIPPVAEKGLTARANPELLDAGSATADATVERSGRTPVEETLPEEEPDPLVIPEDGVPYEFEIRVLDDFGLSVAGAEVLAAPLGLPLNALGRTGPDGRLTARWFGRTPSMEVAWRVRRGGRTSALFRERVFAEQRNRIVGLHASPFSVRRRRGEIAFELRGLMQPSGGLRIAGGSGAPEVERRETGEIEFVDPLEWGFAGGLTSAIVVSAGQSLVLTSATSGILVTPPRGADPSPPAVIQGYVRNAAGDPLGGVPVTVGPDDEVITGRTETDGNGSFALADLPTPWCVVRAGGGPFGLAFLRTGVEPGQELAWEATLDRGLVATGRLITPGGAPLAGWRVEFADHDARAPWRGAVTTGSDGRFAVPNCPPRALRMECFAPGRNQLPALVVEGIRAGTEEREHVLADADRLPGAAFVRVVDEGDEILPLATARLWQVASGRGMLFHAAGEDGPRSIQGVPPGEYVVETGAARRGWIESGAVFLGGGGAATDLGTFRLPRPGAELAHLELRFDPPRPWPDDAVGAVLHRLDPTVATEVLLPRGGNAAGPRWQADVTRPWTGRSEDLALPPGDYVLRFQDAERGPRDHPFSLAPGGVRRLSLTLRDGGVRVEDVTANDGR